MSLGGRGSPTQNETMSPPPPQLPRQGRRPSLETAARSDREARSNRSLPSGRSQPAPLRGLMSLGGRGSPMQNETMSPPAVAVAAAFPSSPAAALPQLFYDAAPAADPHVAPALFSQLEDTPVAPPAAMNPLPLAHSVPYVQLTRQDLWANAMHRWEQESVNALSRTPTWQWQPLPPGRTNL